MDAASIFAPVNGFHSSRQPASISLRPNYSKQILIPRNNGNNYVTNKRWSTRTSAIADLSAITSDSSQVEITWQIVVGALAGVTPFVVAGIEFGKRILQQRLCGVCKGSGLVLRDDQQYIRCPGCGGWLPWQSWRRFFTG